MRLTIQIEDYGIMIGNAADKTYVDPDNGNETITIQQPEEFQAFSVVSFDDKNYYSDAIEAHLISVGIASAEAKSVAKLAKDLAKDVI